MPQHRLGLALSGGSIKGFAHLGVLQYMEEIGLRPDIIAGTSAGALMGAFYADGYSPREIFEIFSPKGFMDMASLRPMGGGVFDTSKFIDFISERLHHKHLEDLPVPIRIVATNLDKGEQQVFDSGPLAQIITASCSIPVLFNPIELDGTTYVDGGLFRNFPVSVIREMCTYVVGVNLGPWQEEKYKRSIMGVAERSWEFVFRQNTLVDRELCDLLLETLEITKYGMFEVNQAAEIMQIGYELARQGFGRHDTLIADHPIAALQSRSTTQ